MPFNIGMGEMILIFLIVLLLTGGRRLPEIGARLGHGIRQFKGSMAEVDRVREALSPSAALTALLEPSAPKQLHYGVAVRTMLARSCTEAVRLQHPWVRPDHLLMALTLEPDRATLRVLETLHVRLDDVQWRLKEALVLGDEPVDADVPYGAAAQRVISVAMTEAERLGHRRVDPVHVLLGLLAENDAAAEVLRSLGVTLWPARAAAASALRGA
jgi:sec-independent protein translocase protein TatA